MRRLITAFLAATALIIGVAACSSEPSIANTVEVGADTIILDVRTPEEYADGHLEGAQLLNFNSGEFTEALPTLDPEAEYLIYCRSGNRAGQALGMMEQAGFTNAASLGSLERAALMTGVPVVK